jgi:hypothetical protein
MSHAHVVPVSNCTVVGIHTDDSKSYVTLQKFGSVSEYGRTNNVRIFASGELHNRLLSEALYLTDLVSPPEVATRRA